MERYCAYLRKSRADRDAELRGEGETLARHRHILEELSQRMRKPVERWYAEVVSGDSIAARPVMQELLQDIENGMWNGVFVVEVERLARGDTIDQGIVSRTFQFTDTKIITPVKTYDPANEYDNEYFEFSLFMSRREYKTINRRMQAGRVASVKEGNYIGSHDPFGYHKLRLPGPEKGFTLEIVPDEAETVRMIFEWFVNGDGESGRLGRNMIANRLNDMHRYTKTGKPWTYSTIETVLSNPIHAGYVRWNHRATIKSMEGGKVSEKRPRNEACVIVPGKHPAIINKELYDQAQVVRQQRCKPAFHARVKTISSPLAGIIDCGICGHKMQYRLRGSQSPRDTLLCPYHCGCKGAYFDMVESAMLDGLKDIIDGYKADLTAAGQRKTTNLLPKQISKLQSDKAAEQAKLNQIFDFLESGVYSVEVFQQRKAVIDQRIRELDQDISALREQYESQSTRLDAMRTYIPKAESFLAAYDTMTAAEKNTMLRELVDHAVYTKTQRAQRGQPSAPFTLDIFPSLPL